MRHGISKLNAIEAKYWDAYFNRRIMYISLVTLSQRTRTNESAVQLTRITVPSRTQNHGQPVVRLISDVASPESDPHVP